MRANTRMKLEMGERVLKFCEDYPDSSPGYAAGVARLKQRVERAQRLAEQQVDGRAEIGVATGRKRKLRRLITQAHLDHLANVAEIASVEEPELRKKFAIPSDATTYLAFRAAASSIAAEAESRKELLMRHGLAEEVLSGLKTALEQFEDAIEQGSAGRLARAGATAELLSMAQEVVQEVKVMNGLVLIRFANKADALAAWESAINVFAVPRPDEKPVSGQPPVIGQPPVSGQHPVSGGDIKPAA